MREAWLELRTSIGLVVGVVCVVAAQNPSVPFWLAFPCGLVGGGLLGAVAHWLHPRPPVVAFITLDAAEALKRDLERGRDPFKGRLH